MNFRFVGHQLREHATEAQRLFTKRRSNQIVAGGRRVAFIENEVDHLEHRREPRRAFLRTRNLERNARFGKRPLRTHDSLRNRRFRHDERAGDLVGRQPSEQAQRQRNPCFRREQRVAGNEHQPQQVVADVIVEGRIDAGLLQLLRELELVTESARACVRSSRLRRK